MSLTIREYVPRENSVCAIQFVKKVDMGEIRRFSQHKLINVRDDATFDGKLSGEIIMNEEYNIYIFEGDYLVRDDDGNLTVLTKDNFEDKYRLKEEE